MILDPTEYFAERGVTDKWILEQRGVQRAGEGGIMIPFYSVPDALPSGYEIRLAESMDDGRKFTKPKGQKAVLNIHPSMRDAVQDITQPLFVVEGTTRADALAQRSTPAVSLAGCWGWMSDNKALADWDSVPIKNRDCVIGLDGDVVVNPDVNAAMHRIGALLVRKGASRVRVLVLPDNMGVDDYLASGGHITRILEHARDLESIVPLKPKKQGKEQRARKIVGDINDTALAEDFVNSKYCHVMQFVQEKTWAYYTEGRWHQANTDVPVGSQVTDLLVDKAAAIKDDDEVRDLLLSSSKVSSVTLAVKRNPKIQGSPEEFDHDPYLFNCSNGTLDLRTATLRSHDPDDKLWGISPTPWNPTASAPRWLRFIEEVLPDAATAKTVQQILGAALVGKPLEQILPVLIGGGRNGKSVLINTVGTVLGTDYFGAIDQKLITGSKFDAHPENVMALRGKRLVFASETEAGEKFASASIKRLTGDDLLTGRFMNENRSYFRPTHSLVLITNNSPEVDDTSAAIWARLKKIPFDVSFYGREDKDLSATLEAEAEGILRWLVDGLQDYLGFADGVQFSDEVKQVTGAWQKEENSLLGFLSNSAYSRDKAGRVLSSDFTAAYRAWCHDQDIEPLMTNKMKPAKEQLQIVTLKSHGQVWLKGVTCTPGDLDGDQASDTRSPTLTRDYEEKVTKVTKLEEKIFPIVTSSGPSSETADQQRPKETSTRSPGGASLQVNPGDQARVTKSLFGYPLDQDYGPYPTFQQWVTIDPTMRDDSMALSEADFSGIFATHSNS